METNSIFKIEDDGWITYYADGIYLPDPLLASKGPGLFLRQKFLL